MANENMGEIGLNLPEEPEKEYLLYFTYENHKSLKHDHKILDIQSFANCVDDPENIEPLLKLALQKHHPDICISDFLNNFIPIKCLQQKLLETYVISRYGLEELNAYKDLQNAPLMEGEENPEEKK